MNFPGGSVVKTFLPSNAGDRCNQGAKIPYASGQNLNIKQKQYCNKSSKDFKNGPHQENNLYNQNKTNLCLKKKKV